MTEDPFEQPGEYRPRCPGCGAVGIGHYSMCPILAEEVEQRRRKRLGVCARCNLVRPCEHDEVSGR